MSKFKTIRPSYEDEYESESNSDFDGLENVLRNDNRARQEEDELQSISFGALNSAQEKLRNSKDSKRRSKKNFNSDSESGSDDEDDSGSCSNSDSDNEGFFEKSVKGKPSRQNKAKLSQKKKSKHAPSESSSKKPVSKVREIPGLEDKKTSNLYTDIRFDPAYGKADLAQIRNNYAFLDEYRQGEIQEMQRMLNDRKSSTFLSDKDKDEIKLKIQSLKSRLDTMKNRDLERKILADHKRDQIKNFKDGKQTNPYFLKKSEKRKLIQKAKFDGMKNSQREKVMERKRKRRLGKEFRQLEFNQR